MLLPLCPEKLKLGLIHTCISLYEIHGLHLLEDKYVYSKSVLQNVALHITAWHLLLTALVSRCQSPQGFIFQQYQQLGPRLCIFGWPRLNSPGHGDSCEANLAWAQYSRLLSNVVFHGLQFCCLPCYSNLPLQIDQPFQRALVLEWRWDWFPWVPGDELGSSKCSWQAFYPGDRCVCSAVILLPSP